jgi:tetratricopeptide (TPR) repeat protein
MTASPPPPLPVLFAQGVALHQAGRIAEARAAYEAVLAGEPAHAGALHMLGVVRMQIGETEAAVALMQRAAVADPDSAALHANLAAALSQLERYPAALASCDQAIGLDPGLTAAHANRGNALLALGRPAEALASYDQALALSPPYPEGHYNRGNALRELGRLEEALASYEAALALAPDYLEALGNRGAVLLKLLRPDEALACFEAAVAAHPANALAQRNRGVALARLHRLEEAAASYEAAIALQPDSADAHSNLASVLNDLKRSQAALAASEAAIALDARHVEALNNHGIALYDLRRPDEALASYDRALAVKDDFVPSHLNRSLALLALGDLEGGFAEYRWRWKVDDAARFQPGLPCPAWEGEDLGGKAILVYCEQGYGDSLQFIRYVPRLATMARRVTVLAEAPLVGLFRSLPGVEATDAVTDAAAYDFQVAMMCLPRVFGTTLETIPGETPYLAADPAKAAAWAERLAAYDGLKVGLVWAGASRQHNPVAHAIDRRRSLGLAQLAPLAGLAGVTYFSLQLGEPAAEAPPAGMRLIDLTADLRDFGDTAALVAGLDLVITVDTAVAHLAGALARPVWVLSRFDGCWRWLNGREDSPWYPTARLYHQRAPGAWDEVVRRVAAELARLG